MLSILIKIQTMERMMNNPSKSNAQQNKNNLQNDIPTFNNTVISCVDMVGDRENIIARETLILN